MKVTRLLVGGSSAGSTVSVDSGLRHLQMPILHRLNSFELSNSISEGLLPETFKIEHYRLETLSDRQNNYNIFVANGCNPIVELLNGYRPIVSDTEI